MQRPPDGIQHLVEALFERQPASQPDGSMGAELELIPVRDRSHRRVAIEASDDGPGSADVARDAGRGSHWREIVDAYGAPNWIMPDGGRICYEPGGQLEIISPVYRSPTELARFLAGTLGALRNSASAMGIVLLAVGVDPYNTLEAVPLVLHAPRYDAMTQYFDSIGPSGSRMMRQTASLHVSVEFGPDALNRWALLNALAPYLLARYANSSTYAGRPADYASYRARLWQTLDPTRTGLPFDAADPIGAYTSFAKKAGRFLDDDRAHLTTLFPEIRPRGYLEIRSMDAMEPDRFEQALAFISALTHDADIAAEVMRVIGMPDLGMLHRAAEFGRSDPIINERIVVLERLADESSSSTSGS